MSGVCKERACTGRSCSCGRGQTPEVRAAPGVRSSDRTRGLARRRGCCGAAHKAFAMWPCQLYQVSPQAPEYTAQAGGQDLITARKMSTAGAFAHNSSWAPSAKDRSSTRLLERTGAQGSRSPAPFTIPREKRYQERTPRCASACCTAHKRHANNYRSLPSATLLLVRPHSCTPLQRSPALTHCTLHTLQLYS